MNRNKFLIYIYIFSIYLFQILLLDIFSTTIQKGNFLYGETLPSEATGSTKNGKNEGQWTFYYADGGKWVQCTFQNGLLNGQWLAFYPNGQKEAMGQYKKGMFDGNWTWFYPNGKIFMKGRYENHHKTGQWESYQQDGTLWWKGTYLNDQKHGQWEAWVSGRQVESGNYFNGLRHGNWKIFHNNGKIKFLGNFIQGQKTGLWLQYDNQGKKIRSLDLGNNNGIPSLKKKYLSEKNQPYLYQKEFQLRKKLPPTFRLSWADPFLVASELSFIETQRLENYTILWVHQHMMKDFCQNPPPLGSMKIYLFRTPRSYLEYAKKWYGKAPEGAVGFATGDAILADISTGTGTLVHELIHAYVQADFPNAPVWFNEGLASLYEQSAEINKKIQGLVNWRLPILKKAIKEKNLIPLKVLLELNRQQFNNENMELHYSEARYVCFYLQKLNLLRKFYQQFRENHAQDPNGSKTLMRLLGKDSLEEIQMDWLKYFSKLNQ